MKLDPYKVGQVVGPRAFKAGDYVVIRPDNNVPAKVRMVEPIGVIRVILGDEKDSCYGEANYYPSDLGYPLNSSLWSESQKKQYELCHTEIRLRNRWLSQID